MKNIAMILTAAAVLSLAAAAGAADVEYGSDRPGSDIMNFDLPVDNHDLCRGACEANPNCVAWSYVRRGWAGPLPRCWLKNAIPAKKNSECCVSGTK